LEEQGVEERALLGYEVEYDAVQHGYYGKNAILKGVNYAPAATGRERNGQIGGHRSGKI
jgi:DNA polymerase V